MYYNYASIDSLKCMLLPPIYICILDLSFLLRVSVVSLIDRGMACFLMVQAKLLSHKDKDHQLDKSGM